MKKFLIAAAVLLPLFARAEEAFDPKAYQQLAAACGQNDLYSCVEFAVWTQEHTNAPPMPTHR